MNRFSLSFISRAAALTAVLVVLPLFAAADTVTMDFESYTDGIVNAQDGWSATGSAGSGCAVYDHAIASSNSTVGFGSKSLRLSNAVTSGCFGDQTFSKSLVDEAGDAEAVNGGMSGGTRQNRFEAEFDFTSATGTYQPGLFLSVNPDRGDGARMSYLGFADTADGIDVNFYDVQSTGDPAVFSQTMVADNLDRTAVHTAKFVIQFVDGSSNDIVEIYIDGTLVHTGTTWENYFRFDDESQNSDPALVNKSRTVDSLLFRAGGTAAPATAGAGFLVDNITLTSSTVTGENTSEEIDVHGDTSAGENQPGWLFNRDTSTQTPFEFNREAASTGKGSLFVLPIENNSNGNSDKFIGELFLLTDIASISSLSYDFKIGAPSADVEEQFYMSVYANFGTSDATKYYDCRYNVVPTVGSTDAFTTVTFDPTQSYPVTTRTGGQASPFACPSVPADMNNLSDGSSIRAIALNVGDTSGNDMGVSGFLDTVKVVTKDALDMHTVTYDFEPINNAPVANNGSILVKKNTPKAFNLGASDADGDTITIAELGEPAHGVLSGTAPTLSYAPDIEYLGDDSFTFTVTDGEDESNEGTVSITVVEDITTPTCAEEDMEFIGGGLDKCMNLNALFENVLGLSFIDSFGDLVEEFGEENFDLFENFLSFLDAIPGIDFGTNVDEIFPDPVCAEGSVFNGDFDVCVDYGTPDDDNDTDGDADEDTGTTDSGNTDSGSSTNSGNSSSSRGGGGGGGGGGYIAPTGQVLGASTSCYQFTRTLVRGMNSTDVTELQKILIAKGYMTVTANGNFGPATEAGVKAYQRANGLEQVGAVGPKTRALLNVCAGTPVLTEAERQALIAELVKKLNELLEKIKALQAAQNN